MEISANIPFHLLLTWLERLTPVQKAVVRKALDRQPAPDEPKNDRLINLLLNGPVYNDEQVEMVEQARRSLEKWRAE